MVRSPTFGWSLEWKKVDIPYMDDTGYILHLIPQISATHEFMSLNIFEPLTINTSVSASEDMKTDRVSLAWQSIATCQSVMERSNGGAERLSDTWEGRKPPWFSKDLQVFVKADSEPYEVSIVHKNITKHALNRAGLVTVFSWFLGWAIQFNGGFGPSDSPNSYFCWEALMQGEEG